MITQVFCVSCEWFAGAWSAAQSYQNGSVPTSPPPRKARSGSKTLIYGTAAGIDPHRINRSKLPPWYIAGPCYRSPPTVNFPHSPQGQLSVLLDKVAERFPLFPPAQPHMQLLQHSWLHPSGPCAPITNGTPSWPRPPSPSTVWLERHVYNVRRLQVEVFRNTITL